MLGRFRASARFSLVVLCGIPVFVAWQWVSPRYGRIHLATVLAASARTRTYQAGSRLYLDNGTVKVGLETLWGGSIVEIVWHGINFVNAYDTGREVQVALYDGDAYPPCGDCSGALGWNPVQGGDWHKHGSPLIAHTLGDDFIYIKTKPHQWYPDNKGGGKDQAVPGDVFIEQRLSFLPDTPFGIKAHYKITHFGKDQHANTLQEFPAVYANWEFGQFVYYGGEAPWTNGPVSFLTMPNLPQNSPVIYTPEKWGAFVNDQGVGLTVFVPGQYAYASGFKSPPSASKNSGTHYFFPCTPFSFGPNSVLEGDIYLYAGNYREARKEIYSLKKTLPPRDIFPPFGIVDLPKRDSKVNGPLNVSGWAFDNTRVSGVDVFLDGQLVGHASYGAPRSDVSQTWPNAPSNLGFDFTVDTTKYPNGRHILRVNASDGSGNVAIFPKIPILIDNPAGQPKNPS